MQQDETMVGWVVYHPCREDQIMGTLESICWCSVHPGGAVCHPCLSDMFWELWDILQWFESRWHTPQDVFEMGV